MKKNELLNKISDLWGQVDNLIASIENLKDDAKSIGRAIEYLPSEPEEIEDDEVEKEDD